MKVLISVDIEGIGGVFNVQQTRAGNPEYERARRWMTLEANAAVEGAFAGGASEVWVNDSHGGFNNLLPDEIDARARVILGKPRMLGMMAGLEHRPALVFMIGYHAMAQSRGMLAHTINSFAFARVLVDGVETGEAGLYGALAQEYGARVALLSGDDVFERETRPVFPEAKFVVVKHAGGHASGDLLTPAASSERIRDAAREAVGQIASDGAWWDRACAAPRVRTCELHTQTPALADLFSQWPSVERAAGSVIRFVAPTAEYLVRTLNSLSAMSAVLR
ncbi:M55 family metallopeptidase [Paraburkholderia sp. J11-2]|uniref:M55 family metallopeptidase n=1 Tax=Paraburkholderia sp. J11-2 TaxID=2805431 RepID=UPI002AB7BE22|nr:M55 family metallopeptidase [Paraburkholderia sp. J11-2]